MIITKIQKQKGKKSRYNIFIDGKEQFSISDAVLIENGLIEGKEITIQEFENLKKEAVKSNCEECLLSYLDYRMRSEREIFNHLRKKGYPIYIIMPLIQKYKKYGYINDMQFAKKYLEDLINFHAQGKFMLKYKLQSKGISKDLAEHTINEILSPEKEIELAITLLKKNEYKFKKFKGKELYSKVYAFLRRKGFSNDIIREAIEHTTEITNYKYLISNKMSDDK